MKKITVFIFAILLYNYPVKAENPVVYISGNDELVEFFTDRLLYLTGESLFFAAEVINPTSDQISKVLYVDIFSNEKNRILSSKYLVVDGFTSGIIKIPKHLQTGYYLIRVYTRNQNNYPSWQNTAKVLKIVNPELPLQSEKVNRNNKFKHAILNDGRLGFYWDILKHRKIIHATLIKNGVIYDDSLKYYKNGLMFSSIIATKGEYNINLFMENGERLSKIFSIDSLPVFSCVQESNDLVVISKVPVNQSLTFRILNLRTHKLTEEKVTFFKNNAKVTLASNDFGLCYLSLTDSKSNVVFETMIYIRIRTEEREGISIEKSDGQIKVQSEERIFSASLIIKGSNSNQDSLLPEYFIWNPLYINCINKWFNQSEVALAMQSHDIMSYLHMYKNGNVICKPEIIGQTLQGRISEKNLDEGKVFCSILGENPQFYAVKPHENGCFVIQLTNTENVSDVYLVSFASDTTLSETEIFSGFNQDVPYWNSIDFLPQISDKELLIQMFINMQIDNLVEHTKIGSSQTDFCCLPFFGENLTKVRMEDFIQMDNTRELFNEIVPFVKVRNQNKTDTFVVLDDNTGLQYTNPLVLFDNIFYQDINPILSLQPSEFVQVDVINHRYVFGEFIFNGIISITSSSDNFAGIPMSENGIFFNYESPQQPVWPVFEDNYDNKRFSNTFNWIGNTRSVDFQIPYFSFRNYILVISRRNSDDLIIDLSD